MKHPITPRGHNVLKEQLKAYKIERPVIANEIETARAHGDLSENADYHAAREKSGILEAKIRDVEAKLSTVEVIDPSKLTDLQKVVFGVTVEIEDLDSGEEKTISIYGPSESDTSKGWISIDTPLAKSLIGKEVGDVATMRLPSGVREYEVMKIRVDYK